MNALAQEIARHFPDSHKAKFQITLHPPWRAPNGGNAFFSVLLPILKALAGVVLLLACASARYVARKHTSQPSMGGFLGEPLDIDLVERLFNGISEPQTIEAVRGRSLYINRALSVVRFICQIGDGWKCLEDLIPRRLESETESALTLLRQRTRRRSRAACRHSGMPSFEHGVMRKCCDAGGLA
jgi:hypothetical protein